MPWRAFQPFCKSAGLSGVGDRPRPDAEGRPVPTIEPVTPPASPTRDSQDPNASVAGARQRWGPFWIEEPRWYWALAILTLLVGLLLFLLAVGFDRP